MAFGPKIEFPPITRDNKESALTLEPIDPLRNSKRAIPSYAELQTALPYLLPEQVAALSSLRLGAASRYYQHLTGDSGTSWSIAIDGVSKGVTGYSKIGRQSMPFSYTYIFDRSWQGQGIGSRIGPVITKYVFEVEKYKSLQTFIDMNNEPSFRLAQQLGSVCVSHVALHPRDRDKRGHHLFLHNPSLDLKEASGVKCLHGPTWADAQERTRQVLVK